MLSVVITLMLLVSFTGVALAFDSGGTPLAPGADTIKWTGQGGGDDFEEECPSGDTVPGGIDPYNYLHWIVTTDGGSADSATLNLGGTGSGSYSGTPTGGAFHFFTPYFDLSGLSASADINVVKTGNGTWNLTISHGCSSGYEDLAVSKTVVTSFTREHFWSIAKSVDPTDLYLYIPGQGSLKPSTGTATWIVYVTYKGYTDSDWNVSGVITITNIGTLDAVITDVTDSLAPADCGVTFPFTLVVGATLPCSYSYDGYVEGKNEVTVTTERHFYGPESVDIVWGDPTTEINKTVTVVDSVGGELGTVTAPNNAHFTYTRDFTWGEFGDSNCGNHTYSNTAKVIGDDDVVLDQATAVLNVHVQCHVFETAYGKGTNPTCFIPTFSNWGWTNSISTFSVQTWNLWAGAAMCATSKGTLVGTVTVNYGTNGYVNVNYNVAYPYILSETHVYAGYTKFQKFGKTWTVAPGQYTNVGGFSGPIYVIAHAKVGLPDPNFP